MPYYKRYCKEEIDIFTNQILSKQKINSNTKKFFLKRWLKYYFKNLSSINKTPLFFPKSQNYKKSLTFIGASPTVESQIDILRHKRETDFYLASDTASRFLIKQKVDIDMILSVDSGLGTLYHLQNNNLKIPYLTWLGANPYIFEKTNMKYIYFSTFPLDQILQQIFFLKSPILENPSLNMAGIAKSFAKMYHFTSFYSIGTDAVVEKGKTHCRGTGYEFFYLNQYQRKKTLYRYSNLGLEYKIVKKNIQNETFNPTKVIENIESKKFSLNMEHFFEQILNNKDISNYLKSELNYSTLIRHINNMSYID